MPHCVTRGFRQFVCELLHPGQLFQVHSRFLAPALLRPDAQARVPKLKGWATRPFFRYRPRRTAFKEGFLGNVLRPEVNHDVGVLVGVHADQAGSATARGKIHVEEIEGGGQQVIGPPNWSGSVAAAVPARPSISRRVKESRDWLSSGSMAEKPDRGRQGSRWVRRADRSRRGRLMR